MILLMIILGIAVLVALSWWTRGRRRGSGEPGESPKQSRWTSDGNSWYGGGGAS